MDKRVLGNKTKRCLNGKVGIFIQCYRNSFKITLTISSKISKGELLEDENEKVVVKLVSNRDISEEISITREVSYREDDDGSLNPVEITIPYSKHALIRGEVTVFPEFYMPLGMLKYARLNQETKRNPFVKLNTKTYQQSSPSKFIPYTTSKPSRHCRG